MMEANKRVSGYLHLIEGETHKHTILYIFKSLEQEEELLNSLLSEAEERDKAFVILCDEDNNYVCTMEELGGALGCSTLCAT
jgi:hypothetical protein